MMINDFQTTLRLLQDGKKWIKTELVDDRGHRCMLGALGNAHPDELQDEVEYRLKYSPQLMALGSVIREQYGDRLPDPNDQLYGDVFRYEDSDWASVWLFNDHPDTTFSEVRSAIEKAAVQMGELI